MREAIVVAADNTASRIDEYTYIADPQYGGGRADDPRRQTDAWMDAEAATKNAAATARQAEQKGAEQNGGLSQSPFDGHHAFGWYRMRDGHEASIVEHWIPGHGPRSGAVGFKPHACFS